MSSNIEPNAFQTRNTLTVGLFCGAMLGFLVAMALGAFPLEDRNSLTDWITAAAAVGATGISAAAVILVSHTLQATRKTVAISEQTLTTTEATLLANQAMAREQRRLGELQTRPWLFLESAVGAQRFGSVHIQLKLKNYGTTPAIEASASASVSPAGAPDHPSREPGGTWKSFKRETQVAPSGDFDFIFSVPIRELARGISWIDIEWKYKNHDHTIEDASRATITLYEDEHGDYSIRSFNR